MRKKDKAKNVAIGHCRGVRVPISNQRSDLNGHQLSKARGSMQITYFYSTLNLQLSVSISIKCFKYYGCVILVKFSYKKLLILS